MTAYQTVGIAPHPQDEFDRLAAQHVGSAATGEDARSAVADALAEAYRETARLRGIVERADQEIYTCDARTLRFTDANKAARENLGYRLDELWTMTPLDINPTTTREKLDALLAPLRNGERDFVTIQGEHRRRNGTRYPMSVRVQLHRAGGRELMVAFVTDRTDFARISTQMRLAVSAARFHYTDWDLRTGRIDRDPGVDRLYGFDDHDPDRGAAEFRARVKPEDLERNLALFDAVRRRELPQFDSTFEVRLPDGGQRWLRAVGQLSALAPDHIVGLQCDVTETVLVAQARERSERDLQNLFRSMPDLVSRALPDTTLTFVNDAWARSRQCAAADAVGRKFLDLLPQAQRDSIREELARLSPESPMITREERWTTAEGAEVCVLWTTLMTYEDGQPVELVSIGRNITAQDAARRTIERQARELEASNAALRISEQRFQQAAQGSSVGIWDWVLDDEDNQFWSDKLYALMGYQRGEVASTWPAFLELLHPDDRQPTEAAIERHLRGEGKYECEFRLRHKTGGYRWFFDTGHASRDADGKPTRMVGSMMDIHDRKIAEAELRRSEERFRSLYNDTPMMLHSVDGQRRLVAVSDYWLEQMGYQRDEVIGRPVLSFMTPASQAEFRRAGSAELAATDQIRDFPHQLVRKDGTLMDCLLSAVRTRNEAGEIEQTLGVAIDVTEKRRVEEALARQQRELQLIFDHAPVRIWYKDDQNRVLRLNKRAAQSIGMTVESAEGIGLFGRGPAVTDQDRAQDLEVIRSGKPLLGLVEQQTTADGRIEWTRTDKVPYVDPETGRTQLLATSTDITEQKVAELKLAQQKRELELIFNNVPVKIFYKDDRNRILRLNKRAADSLGMTVEQAEGAACDELFPTMAQKYHADDLEVIASGRPKYGIVEEYAPANGDRCWMATDKVPYTDPVTGQRNILVSASDITDLKNAQLTMAEQAIALQRSNEELEQFAYVASHDLKAPLRGIDNLASWLEEDLADKMDEESRANMILLRGRVARLERLLNDLLEFSRVGRNRTEVTQVDLAEVVTEVFDLVRGGAAFTLRCGPLPTLATGVVPLQLVIRNLISNAIKHHDRPEGALSVEASDLGDQYRISVADDGPGIDPQFHERIFGMFQVLKPRDQVEGSGLGLAIIDKQLRTLGCDIRIESDPAVGRGTTFHFTWPKRWPYGEPTSAAA